MLQSGLIKKFLWDCKNNLSATFSYFVSLSPQKNKAPQKSSCSEEIAAPKHKSCAEVVTLKV